LALERLRAKAMKWRPEGDWCACRCAALAVLVMAGSVRYPFAVGWFGAATLSPQSLSFCSWCCFFC